MTMKRKTRHCCGIVLILLQITAASTAASEEACTLMSWTASPELRSHVLTTDCNPEAGQGLVCFWEFAYRNPAAQTLYVTLGDGVANCVGKDAETVPDTGVNHPDSYVLRQFASEGRIISVSLKDKAQQEKTLVFLRIGSDSGN